MTTLFEPFAPLFELTRDMERLLGGQTTAPSFLPPADVVVSDDDVTVFMDVPGMKVDDLTIELQDETLTVRGERAVPYGADGDGQRSWQRLERGFGTFERILHVPRGLDAGSIRASMSDGVLKLVLPKPLEHKPRRIEIATDGQATLDGTATEQRELAGAAA